MKKNLAQKITIKTSNLLKKADKNEEKYKKNSALKLNRKIIEKSFNDFSSINKLNKNILERGMYTRQNSNKLMETLFTSRRNLSNKKLFLSNSYQKREKFGKTSEIINNKIMANKYFNTIKLNNNTNTNLRHKKLLSLQTNINNTKNNIKINIKNPKINSVIYKQNLLSTKFKYFLTLLNKDQNNQKALSSRTNFQQNKILHKSLEQRNKISKFKLSQNIKTKILKNKINKKETGKKEKSEIFFTKPFPINNNEKSYTCRNKPPSKIEICQTFSKEENNKNKENNFINNNNDSHKNENLLKININKNQDIIEEHIKPKTSTSKENKQIILKEREFKTPMASKSLEKYRKLKNLIEDYCLNNDKYKKKYTAISMKTKNKKQKHNSISFNRNKSNLTSGNLIKKELKGIKQYIYDYSIEKHIESLNIKNLESGNKNDNNKKEKEKNKNNDIFEVISDIKVKSLNEYEEEKKADEKSKITTTIPNENKINNNININININYNNININNKIDKENNTNIQNNLANNNIKNKDNINNNFNNGIYIEDRDEYESLKETFSKDRFSFRPINEENSQIPPNLKKYNNNNNNISNNNQYNYNVSDKNLITKKDLGNANIINNNILNNYKIRKSLNNNKLDSKNLMKNEISKINKLKKIVKNKPNSKLLKDNKILNRSVELRHKKLNKD